MLTPFVFILPTVTVDESVALQGWLPAQVSYSVPYSQFQPIFLILLSVNNYTDMLGQTVLIRDVKFHGKCYCWQLY